MVAPKRNSRKWYAKSERAICMGCEFEGLQDVQFRDVAVKRDVIFLQEDGCRNRVSARQTGRRHAAAVRFHQTQEVCDAESMSWRSNWQRSIWWRTSYWNPSAASKVQHLLGPGALGPWVTIKFWQGKLCSSNDPGRPHAVPWVSSWYPVRKSVNQVSQFCSDPERAC